MPSRFALCGAHAGGSRGELVELAEAALASAGGRLLEDYQVSG